MDKVLTRVLFRDNYLKSLNRSVSNFNKGGLASLKIHHFDEGGSADTGAVDPKQRDKLLNDIGTVYTEGEKKAMLLAPIASALLTGTQMPGQSPLGAVASNIGAALPRVQESSIQIKKLENERLNEISRLAKATQDPFQIKLAAKDADNYENTNNLSKSARSELSDIQVLEHVLKNPDVELGTFSGLRGGIERLAQSVGIDSVKMQKLTGQQLVQTLGGKMALANLRDLKGSISDKEGAWLKSINPDIGMTKEQIQSIIEIRKRVAERDIDYANHMNKWVDTYGNLRAKRNDGSTWSDYSRDFLDSRPTVDKKLLDKLDTLGTAGISGGGQGMNANIVTDPQTGKQYLRTLDKNGKPDYKPYSTR